MGCIGANVIRASESCNVEVNKTTGIKAAVISVITAITAAVTFVSSLVVRVTHEPTNISVAVTTEDKVKVEVGLICTVAVSDELEMWWCDGWKALWNNRLKILWRQE